MISAEVTRRTQFYDLDPMKIVWHGNYVRYLEQARAALLDEIGYGYREMEASGFAWPIVDLSIKYVRPLKLSPEVHRARDPDRVREPHLHRLSGVRRRLARGPDQGRTVQLAVSIATGEMSFESPPELIACVRSRL